MLNKEAHHNYLPPPELSEVISSLWSFKIYIIILCFFAAIASAFIAINTPNIYRAETLLAPTESLQGQGSEVSSQLGGLASLAGLGGLDNKGFKTEVAQARIFTKDFLYQFINNHDLLVNILAIESWDKETNKITYNDDIYDSETQSFTLPEDKNLHWLAYKVLNDNLIISKVPGGLINVAYEHPSPIVAQYIVEHIIKDINQLMQNYDIEQANNSIEYLNKKLTQTNVADMKTVFYRLIEEQTKNKMLTEIKSEYIFTTLDPALVPEEKSGPRRALIVAVSVILAGMFGCFLGLIRFYRAR
ncbi:Wzz/FepE/Etk N-terminal domain-containing protein [Pseudoalteromonas sp. Z9A5]|uniref:Wzz/FepE/Etk N-terminal domain-containing protein n=1 Tax=Pseudoalteromonas sp. Z9A5 TaxID=2686355 RepID=UPI00140ABE88|nr:Wzz/FepE/Etk N-terminal domain-containing protein [Pseudoalteromonas sp. Z9A5]